MISGGSSWWCVTKLYTSAFTSDFGVFSLHFCLSPRHYSTEIIRIAGQFVFLLFRNDWQSFWNEIFPECAKTFWGPRKKGYKQLPWETEIFFIQPISDLGDNPGWNWTLHGWKGNAWIIVIIALRIAFASKCTLQFLANTWLLSKYVNIVVIWRDVNRMFGVFTYPVQNWTARGIQCANTFICRKLKDLRFFPNEKSKTTFLFNKQYNC